MCEQVAFPNTMVDRIASAAALLAEATPAIPCDDEMDLEGFRDELIELLAG